MNGQRTQKALDLDRRRHHCLPDFGDSLRRAAKTLEIDVDDVPENAV